MKNNDFAKRLKELRLQKGFSQEELASEAGLSLRTVQRIENGETEETEARGDSMRRLAQALGIPADNVAELGMREDKGFILLTNLSALSFLLFPFMGFILPLILWVSKRKAVQGLDKTGKHIINFQITWTVLLLLSFFIIVFRLASVFKIGNFNGGIMGNTIAIQELIIIVLYLYNIVFIIVNSIRIDKEKDLKYFPAIPFFSTKEH